MINLTPDPSPLRGDGRSLHPLPFSPESFRNGEERGRVQANLFEMYYWIEKQTI